MSAYSSQYKEVEIIGRGNYGSIKLTKEMQQLSSQ